MINEKYILYKCIIQLYARLHLILFRSLTLHNTTILNILLLSFYTNFYNLVSVYYIIKQFHFYI